MKQLSFIMLFSMVYLQADDNWSFKPKPPTKPHRPSHVHNPHNNNHHHDRHAPLASRFAHTPLHNFEHDLLASLYDLSAVEYHELQSYTVEQWQKFFHDYQQMLVNQQQQDFLSTPATPLMWQVSVMKLYGLYTIENFRAAMRSLPDYDQIMIVLGSELAHTPELHAQLTTISKQAAQLGSLYQKVINAVCRRHDDIATYIAQEAHAAQQRIYDRWVAQQTGQARRAVSGQARGAFLTACHAMEQQSNSCASTMTMSMRHEYASFHALLRAATKQMAIENINNIAVHPQAQSNNKPLVTAQIKQVNGFGDDESDIAVHRHHMIGSPVHNLLYDYARTKCQQLQALVATTNNIKDTWQRHAICQTAHAALKQTHAAYRAVEEHELIDALEYLHTATQLHAHAMHLTSIDQPQVNRWQQRYDTQLQKYAAFKVPTNMLHLERFKEHQQRLQDLRDACAKLHTNGTVTKNMYALTDDTYRLLQEHNIAPILIEQCVGNHLAHVHHTQMIDLLERTATLYYTTPHHDLVQHATQALCATSVQATCSAQQGNISLMMSLDQTAHALFDMATSCLHTITHAPMVQACLQGAYDGAHQLITDLHHVATHLPELGTSLCKLMFDAAQLCTMLDDMPSMSHAEFQAKARSCADHMQAWCSNVHTTIAQIPTMSYAQLRDALAYNSSYVIAQTCMLDGMFRVLKGAIEVGNLTAATAARKMPAIKNSIQNSLSACAQTLTEQELNVLGMLHREAEVAQLAGIEHEMPLLHFNASLREQHGVNAIASRAGEIEASIEGIEHVKKISSLPPLPEGYSQVNLPRPVYKKVKGTGENCRIVQPTDEFVGWEVWAPKKYDEIRGWTDDVTRIAHNTGWKEYKIRRIKQHLFYRKHKQVKKGGIIDLLDADPEIAVAWDRMYVGDFIQNDIRLLEHEYFESKFEGIFKTDLDTAHEATVHSDRIWNAPIFED